MLKEKGLLVALTETLGTEEILEAEEDPAGLTQEEAGQDINKIQSARMFLQCLIPERFAPNAVH